MSNILSLGDGIKIDGDNLDLSSIEKVLLWSGVQDRCEEQTIPLDLTKYKYFFVKAINIVNGCSRFFILEKGKGSIDFIWGDSGFYTSSREITINDNSIVFSNGCYIYYLINYGWQFTTNKQVAIPCEIWGSTVL